MHHAFEVRWRKLVAQTGCFGSVLAAGGVVLMGFDVVAPGDWAAMQPELEDAVCATPHRGVGGVTAAIFSPPAARVLLQWLALTKGTERPTDSAWSDLAELGTPVRGAWPPLIR